MRMRIFTAAVAAMLAMPAQDADTGKVTPACEGTTTLGDGPVSESVLVDYNAKKIFSQIAGPVKPQFVMEILNLKRPPAQKMF